MATPGNANAERHLSAQGMQNLQVNEGLRRRYYNDTANNCTYGVGTFVHYGPCTAADLRHAVTMPRIQAHLAIGVRTAERIVRRAVPDHELTQEQFDAAVSFAYNLQDRAIPALEPANRGDMATVARNMGHYIYDHQHDAHGRVVGPARRNQGLVNRRRREAAPFQGATQ